MVVNNVHVQYFHKIKNNKEVLLLDMNTKFKAPFWDTKEAILINSCGMVGCMQVIFLIGVSISKLSISTSDESLLFFTLTPVFDIFVMIFKFLKTSFWVREINHAVNLTSSQNFFIEMMVKRGYTLDQNEFHVTCGPSLLPEKAFQFLQLGLCILEFRTQLGHWLEGVKVGGGRGSTSNKLKGSQEHKTVEIFHLALYCNPLTDAVGSTSMELGKNQLFSSLRQETADDTNDQITYFLQPMNVFLKLMVHTISLFRSPFP